MEYGLPDNGNTGSVARNNHDEPILIANCESIRSHVNQLARRGGRKRWIFEGEDIARMRLRKR